MRARRRMKNAHRRSSFRSSDDSEDLVCGLGTTRRIALAAVDTDGHLAPSAESCQCRAFSGYGKASWRMIEKGDSIDGLAVTLAGFNA